MGNRHAKSVTVQEIRLDVLPPETVASVKEFREMIQNQSTSEILDWMFEYISNALKGSQEQHSQTGESSKYHEILNLSNRAINPLLKQWKKINDTKLPEQTLELGAKALEKMGQYHLIFLGFMFLGDMLNKAVLMCRNKDAIVKLLESLLTLIQIIRKRNDQNEDLLTKAAMQYVIKGVMECLKVCEQHAKPRKFTRFVLSKSREEEIKEANTSLNQAISMLVLDYSCATLEGVQKISRQMTLIPRINPSAIGTENVVGIEDRIKDVERLIQIDSNIVAVGVCVLGHGGIGKSTLAKSVINKIDRQGKMGGFIFCSVKINNSRKPDMESHLVELQAQILYHVTGQKVGRFDIKTGQQELKKALESHSVFLLIDDIEEINHVKCLLPSSLNIKQGNKFRMLITSRYIEVANLPTLNSGNIVTEKYNAKPLSTEVSATLLKKLIHNKEYKHFTERFHGEGLLVEQTAVACGGIPILLTVLGSYLQSERNQECYDIVLENVKSGNFSDYKNEKLHESLSATLLFVYNGLEEKCKEVFLDVCVFFNRKDWKETEHKLGDVWLKKLEQRMFIQKEWEGNRQIIAIHDVLTAIAQKESNNQGTRLLIRSSDEWDEFKNSKDFEKRIQNLEALFIVKKTNMLEPISTYATRFCVIAAIITIVREAVTELSTVNAIATDTIASFLMTIFMLPFLLMLHTGRLTSQSFSLFRVPKKYFLAVAAVNTISSRGTNIMNMVANSVFAAAMALSYLITFIPFLYHHVCMTLDSAGLLVQKNEIGKRASDDEKFFPIRLVQILWIVICTIKIAFDALQEVPKEVATKVATVAHWVFLIFLILLVIVNSKPMNLRIVYVRNEIELALVCYIYFIVTLWLKFIILNLAFVLCNQLIPALIAVLIASTLQEETTSTRVFHTLVGMACVFFLFIWLRLTSNRFAVTLITTQAWLQAMATAAALTVDWKAEKLLSKQTVTAIGRGSYCMYGFCAASFPAAASARQRALATSIYGLMVMTHCIYTMAISETGRKDAIHAMMEVLFKTSILVIFLAASDWEKHDFHKNIVINLGKSESLRLLYNKTNEVQVKHNCNCFSKLRYAAINDVETLTAFFSGMGSSISPRLKMLSILDCGSLNASLRISQNLQFTKIETLDMTNCTSTTLANIEYLKCLKNLIIHNSYINELPENLCNLESLEYLKIDVCVNLEKLPRKINSLKSLRYLILVDCLQLNCLPYRFGDLELLEEVVLKGCVNLRSLPTNLEKLKKIRIFDLRGCNELKYLPTSFGELSSLETLWMDNCKNLVDLGENFGNLSSLKHLSLKSCIMLSSLPSTFGKLCSLEHLDLSGCKALTALPPGFTDLDALKTLDVRGCENLKNSLSTIKNKKSLVILQ